MSAALLSAEKVAACHKSALLQVISSRNLWINVAALGPNYLTHHPGASRSNWTPHSATRAGEVLLDACTQAGRALEIALDHLHHPTAASAAGLPSEEPQWEKVSAPDRSRRRRTTTALTHPGRGIAR